MIFNQKVLDKKSYNMLRNLVTFSLISAYGPTKRYFSNVLSIVALRIEPFFCSVESMIFLPTKI